MVRLDSYEHGPVDLTGQFVREHSGCPGCELLDRTVYPNASRIDRADHIQIVVTNEHIVPISDEPSGNGAANRATANNDVSHGRTLQHSKAVETEQARYLQPANRARTFG